MKKALLVLVSLFQLSAFADPLSPYLDCWLSGGYFTVFDGSEQRTYVGQDPNGRVECGHGVTVAYTRGYFHGYSAASKKFDYTYLGEDEALLGAGLDVGALFARGYFYVYDPATGKFPYTYVGQASTAYAAFDHASIPVL